LEDGMAVKQQGTSSEVIREIATDSEDRPRYVIKKRERSRFWEVIDPAGELVCLTAYKRGAKEIVRRLVR
jgi:hypothetical protein